MEIVGLDHLQLDMPTGGEGEARRFYRELLGLREVPKPETLASRGGCWFALGKVVLHLGVERDFRPAKRAHPAFRVADLGACRRALEAAGVPIVEDANVPHVRRFYSSDPFGNRLEFLQAGDRF